ncbi:AzlC family ABC transporter permease [Paludibacterium purpuratum]|uniref:4-azaleucine resistance transporter AzlC n=1 Tax=Paludibacterium purpuratum TaxID=1144873 RepID=A0A4R7B9E0_9NEIS|nr:AzlC family ABC transporter permease [Paludibacterium purpuratum]TDR80207.1 4-azaleucine resistance transporter AzlC [Paludibacterium purpuratum]
MNSLSARSALMQGARDTLPMMIGAAPFGTIFGTFAIAMGLSPTVTLAMSALVFAGSSQFIAISLLGTGAALPVIWFTTLVVNLRHMLYSATLLPYARHWSLAWRGSLAFWLTDETFAVVEHRLRTHGAQAGQWYWLGSSLAMYFNWLIWTLAGVLLGRAVPNLAHWGLDFAMVGTFSAIVAPQLKRFPYLMAAIAAGSVALLARGLPYKLDLMLAAAAGIAAGMLSQAKEMPR